MTSGKSGIVSSAVVLMVSVALSLAAAEFLIRLKNGAMTNYDIETWRYSRELKEPSPDPVLDFDHQASKSALLQNVEIRLNEMGLRGGPVRPLEAGVRRILVLGASVALGWGVREDETVPAILQRKLTEAGERVEVLNAGIGNYNAKRYVTRFFKRYTSLKPTDIVVHYFLRDAEELGPGGGNVFLRHSELAVTLWVAYHRLLDAEGERALTDHYRDVYRPDAPGFIEMQRQLKLLADYSRSQHIRLYLALIPDTHNLVNYQFGAIHDTMREVAATNGYVFVDLLPVLRNHLPEEMWAMAGDPHPNALAHRLMAEAIFPVIAGANAPPAVEK